MSYKQMNIYSSAQKNKRINRRKINKQTSNQANKRTNEQTTNKQTIKTNKIEKESNKLKYQFINLINVSITIHEIIVEFIS